MALGSSNITISDVRNALGETTNSLQALCQSNKINVWSRWKPILSDVPLTDAIINAKDLGFTFNLYSSLYLVVPKANNGTALSTTWEYTPPTSNFRLGDFRNYDHEATGLVSLFLSNNEDSININFSLSPSILCNLDKFSTNIWYLNIIGIKSGNINTAFAYQFSDPITLSYTNTLFTLPKEGIANIVGTGTIKIIPVLSNYTIPQNTFIAINKDNPLEGSSSIDPTVTALVNNFSTFSLDIDSGGGSGGSLITPEFSATCEGEWADNMYILKSIYVTVSASAEITLNVGPINFVENNNILYTVHIENSEISVSGDQSITLSWEAKDEEHWARIQTTTYSADLYIGYSGVGVAGNYRTLEGII